jgi:NADH:ubiquinone oxidoreductase subunit 6 (subunit J)
VSTELVYGILVAAALGCAIQAVRAERLLASAVWLAGTSAFTALVIYALGAPQLAVIELSVSAGLVTVVFVLAISISGQEAFTARSLVPKPLALLLTAVALFGLAWLVLPGGGSLVPPATGPVNVLWNERGLDILAQIVLMLAGVLGVLNLIGPDRGVVTGAEERGAAQPVPSTPETPETSDPQLEEQEMVHA